MLSPQKLGVDLFHATVKGDLATIAKLNSASFQDKVSGIISNFSADRLEIIYSCQFSCSCSCVIFMITLKQIKTLPVSGIWKETNAFSLFDGVKVAF